MAGGGAAASERAWDAAAAVYDRMEAAGVAPDAVTFNTLLSAAVGAKQLARAERLFAQASEREGGREGGGSWELGSTAAQLPQ